MGASTLRDIAIIAIFVAVGMLIELYSSLLELYILVCIVLIENYRVL